MIDPEEINEEEHANEEAFIRIANYSLRPTSSWPNCDYYFSTEEFHDYLSEKITRKMELTRFHEIMESAGFYMSENEHNRKFYWLLVIKHDPFVA